jgi:hypothetical protein
MTFWDIIFTIFIIGLVLGFGLGYLFRYFQTFKKGD